MKLSVVLAVFNEAANLASCLDSIQGLAAEIVIVDGGSSDQTILIAKKYQAKIYQTTNKLNFHINKQMAIDKATFRLILQLDADEVVDQQLKTFIKKLILGQLKTQAVAWFISRKNLFLGQWLTKGGQYPDPVIRLFIKGKAKLPQQSVHEQMVVDGQVDLAQGHLLHYSNPDFASYWRKFQTYTDFTAQKLFQAKSWPNLALTLQYFIVKPVVISFLIILRHRGFMDGWRGWLFGLMSGFHYPVAYLKFLTKLQNQAKNSRRKS